MEEGTRARGGGLEDDKEGWTEVGSIEEEVADTEEGVVREVGTAGIGEEVERNEGSREDNKSESAEKEEELGVSTDLGGAKEVGTGGDNQSNKEEEKGT